MTEAAPAASAEAGSVANAPAPTPTPAPAASADADWRASLPEDLRASPALSHYTTIEGLAKSYVNLEKMLGAEKVPVPKEGDEEGTQRFFKAAGWPDKPDGYGFKAPEKLPDGMVYNAELDGKLAGIFHGSKLTASQAAKVREGLMEVVASGASESLDAAKAASAAQALEVERGTQALKEKYGAAYDQKVKVAGATIARYATPEWIAAAEAAGLANHPETIAIFSEIGAKTIGEKELIGEFKELSPMEIDASIADHMNKHSAALMDRTHPDHELRRKERSALFEKKFAGK